MDKMDIGSRGTPTIGASVFPGGIAKSVCSDNRREYITQTHLVKTPLISYIFVQVFYLWRSHLKSEKTQSFPNALPSSFNPTSLSNAYATLAASALLLVGGQLSTFLFLSAINRKRICVQL